MFENFGALFKGSLWTLPWIILLPLGAVALDVTVFNPDGINFSSRAYENSNSTEIWDDFEVWDIDEGDYGQSMIEEDIDIVDTGVNPILSLGSSLIDILLLAAIGVNLVFLLFIPCAFGGLAPARKRTQFYAGFFVNLALALGIPVLLRSLNMFYMAPGYFPGMLLLFFTAYLIPFIAGSRFTAKAFRKAFWFW